MKKQEQQQQPASWCCCHKISKSAQMCMKRERQKLIKINAHKIDLFNKFYIRRKQQSYTHMHTQSFELPA